MFEFLFGYPEYSDTENIEIVIRPSMIRIVKKDCHLESKEEEFLAHYMGKLGIPVNKENIDKEMKNVGLYELIPA